MSFLILSVYALVLNRDANGATSPEWRMKEMTANDNDDFERFRTGAAKYAAYLVTRITWHIAQLQSQ